jgi:hypothetical protein
VEDFNPVQLASKTPVTKTRVTSPERMAEITPLREDIFKIVNYFSCK